MKPIFRLAVASRFEFRDQVTLGSTSLPSVKGRPSQTCFESTDMDLILLMIFFYKSQVKKFVTVFYITN
ncbi:hypothetical protein EHQ55_12640 [Leptospira meyeri]|uniref:hypothetical protein n=1 Tax=Leptospira meyeri TaxID=29508 RepID=UPI00028D4075|nr:hypothetical protein [Leptospira meyeri]EKJ84831.1 hypothetical protein LEP1GSC017_3251 [Leptospira meyeri serovar Hardjo str. Went 5]TGL47949.1 hypothetical protein EHQ55_12640 [Leptospira meyeri]